MKIVLKRGGKGVRTRKWSEENRKRLRRGTLKEFCQVLKRKSGEVENETIMRQNTIKAKKCQRKFIGKVN